MIRYALLSWKLLKSDYLGGFVLVLAVVLLAFGSAQVAMAEVAGATDTGAADKPVTLIKKAAARQDETEAADQGAPAVPEPPSLPDPTEADGPSYRVGEFTFEYAQEQPLHPPLDVISTQLVTMSIELGQTTGGYVGPREGVPLITITLGELSGREPAIFYASALNTICAATVSCLNDHGLIAVFVAPHEEDISPEGKDLRDPANTVLRLVIGTAVVGQVRTIASGERVPDEERVDSSQTDRLHARIKGGSPIGQGDAVRKDLLDDYIYRLNRHPGRRVDAALSSAAGGKVILDYMITENRPWMAYFQVSNTGTEQTEEWRERFGIVNNQLTKNDDILSFDFITAGFSDTHAVTASYERPCFRPRRLRCRVYGAWSTFDASSVGAAAEKFEGEEWSAGGELIANVFQYRRLFIDAVGGARWRHIEVTNYDVPTGLTLARGDEDFFLPYAGIRAERVAETATTQASVIVEWTDSSVSDTDSVKIAQLGRLATDNDWTTLQWDIVQTFFIDRLLKGREWKDPSSDKATLAHEVAVSAKGQHAFGHRLPPQFQSTIGGLYTVRGYPESFVAGDTTVIGSVEYRFHLPRNLKPQVEPGKLFNKPFRFRRQQAYGRPDWDLIFRAFFDAGRAVISRDKPGLGEEDQILMSTGVGVELLVKRNLSLRVDYGVALEGAATSSERVKQGDGRAHVVATILW